jgi:hypothetical protein
MSSKVCLSDAIPQGKLRGDIGRSKIDADLGFPDLLDLKPSVGGNGPVRPRRLYAVAEQSGGLARRHDIAHAIIQEPEKEKEWCRFNDAGPGPATKLDAQLSLVDLF